MTTDTGVRPLTLRNTEPDVIKRPRMWCPPELYASGLFSFY